MKSKKCQSNIEYSNQLYVHPPFPPPGHPFRQRALSFGSYVATRVLCVTLFQMFGADTNLSMDRVLDVVWWGLNITKAQGRLQTHLFPLLSRTVKLHFCISTRNYKLLPGNQLLLFYPLQPRSKTNKFPLFNCWENIKFEEEKRLRRLWGNAGKVPN